MRAYSRTRPLRVAFLIDAATTSAAMLDAIMTNCRYRWGGRFTPIVPCSNGKITSAYMTWLKSYDADIIYSYVPLTQEYRRSLHEELSPGYLVGHESNRGVEGEPSLEPNLPIEPLGSTSTILVSEQASPIFGRQQLELITIHWKSSSYFIRNSFGSLRQQPGADLLEYVTIHTLVDQETLDDPRNRIIGHRHTSSAALVDAIAERRNCVGLDQLAAWATPRAMPVYSQLGRSCNVVVGTSLLDRLVFWNTRSAYAGYLDNATVSLNVSPDELADENFFASFVRLLKNRIHVTDGGSSQPFLTLRSATVSPDQLRELRDRLRAAGVHHVIDVQQVANADDYVPKFEEGIVLRTVRYSEGAAQEREIAEPTTELRPPVVLPLHLRELSPVPGWARRGLWAQDFDIMRSVNHSQYSNVTHRWQLPRRLSAVSAFVPVYGNGGGRMVGRVTTSGALSLPSGIDVELPVVHEPTDVDFFQHALCGHKFEWPFVRAEFNKAPRMIASSIRTSDKGRYLRAILSRAGGIHEAFEIFLNKFWLSEFDRLGASPGATEQRQDEIIQRLKKKLVGAKPGDEEGWNALAKVVLKESQAARKQAGHIRFDAIEKRFHAFRQDYWAKDEQGPPDAEWVRPEIATLPDSLKLLCQRGILHQGHEWKCRRCYNSNWVAVDDLKRIMVCDVCGAQARCPTNDVWRFRLDNYVFEGLREHGMLAYIWCLKKLRDRAQHSFFFSPPLELFYSHESADRLKVDSEVDLIAIGDGVTRLCEVKSSTRNVSIEKFAAVAKHLRPDIATLAIMVPTEVVSNQLHLALEAQFAGSGISSEVLAMEELDIECDPTLPTGGWEEMEGE